MIEIEHLSKRFGDLTAVDDLSLSIPAGELFCFLGPNGAGKTTTIKLMCGLLKPSSGSVRIAGCSIFDDIVQLRRITGYIPDTPFLYERLTVTEFYQFTGDLYGLPRAEVEAGMDAAFEQFGISDHRAALIRDLSHGYRQRMIYAATFLHSPRVLFIDEPFVGLDPHSIRLIHDLLRRKVNEGMTIFLTTHILAFAERLADRIGIISGGRLAALGTLDELRMQSAVQGQLEDVFLSLTREG